MENYKDFEWINAELLPDEYVLWKGKPSDKHILSTSDIVFIPFSIIWCGFALFWETGVLFSDSPFFFKLFGIPFVCVGLYMLFGRFIHQKILLKETFYVLTNRRAIFYRKRKIAYCDYLSENNIQIKLKKNGIGTISFGSADNGFSNGDWVFGNFKSGFSEFVNIPDAQSVHRLITQKKIQK
ncbi:MAG: hypothetical protein E7533_01945 [Ruminococcaceae bacterium]|nr:hypothetical protein [Oscillospiraceae bacterium]